MNKHITYLDNLEDLNGEYILYNHNFIKDKIQIALDIVKEYIIKNDLLIVGGTAIDYALRSNNDKLYNELYQVPDFDIISPNNVEHANNIGSILCNNNFKNVSVIPAIHHTTMRVQLLGFTVFDSTYIPNYLYKKIPSLEYQEFKFVHPNFQKLNQYLSLSLLFKITGHSYNILYRFNKDVNRYNMLEKYYSLPEIDNPSVSGNTFKFNLNSIKTNNLKIINKENVMYIKDVKNWISNNKLDDYTYNIESNFIFNGILAYNIIYHEFKNIYLKCLDTIKFNSKDKDIITTMYNKINNNNIKIDEIDKNYISFDIPNNIELCLLTNCINVDDVIKTLQSEFSINNITKLDNILDYIPKYLESNLSFDKNTYKLKIYDLYGDLLSINMINIQDNIIFIPNYNYIMLYFLTNYYLEEDETIKNTYLSFYNSLHSMIYIINTINLNYNSEFNSIYNYNTSCFNYSINTLGKYNFPDNYYHFVENFKNLIETNQNLNTLPPKNYLNFPDCNISNTFDKTVSSYYNDFQKKINFTNNNNIIQDLKLSN